jgi:hypothetical protein
MEVSDQLHAAAALSPLELTGYGGEGNRSQVTLAVATPYAD